jgi:hypothetical protein
MYQTAVIINTINFVLFSSSCHVYWIIKLRIWKPSISSYSNIKSDTHTLQSRDCYFVHLNKWNIRIISNTLLINSIAELPQISRFHIIYLCSVFAYFQPTPVPLPTVHDHCLLREFFQLLFLALYNDSQPGVRLARGTNQDIWGTRKTLNNGG